MKTVACRIDLGFTRIAGYTLFDQDTFEFQETTPRDVSNLITSKRINGLAFNDKGEIVPDIEGWNLGNIKIKSGVGNYRNFNTENPKGDTVYSVVRAIDIDGIGRIYEVINNRCARVFFLAKQLVALAQFNWIGGIKVNEETDEIELCKGVKVEDQSDREIFELGDKVFTKKSLQDTVMHEMFEAAAILSEDQQEQAASEGETLTEAGNEAEVSATDVNEDTSHQEEAPIQDSEIHTAIIGDETTGSDENAISGEDTHNGEQVETQQDENTTAEVTIKMEGSGEELGEQADSKEPTSDEKADSDVGNESHEDEDAPAFENEGVTGETDGADQSDKAKAPRRSTTSRTSKKKK